MGHAMRCLALAEACRSQGGAASLVLGAIPGLFARRLQEGKFDFQEIGVEPGSREDAEIAGSAARKFRASWIVIDGYVFGSDYQRTLKNWGNLVMVVDDLGFGGYLAADLLLNQNLSAAEGLYPHHGPATRFLLGPRYALLRSEFRKWRGWRRAVPEAGRRVLVTLGGSDPVNATIPVLQALNRISSLDLQVRVLCGPANPHRGQLESVARQSPWPCHICSTVEKMPGLMAWADLAITGAGSTCWELAFMGTPAVALVLAENQRAIAEKLERAGTLVNAGWHHSVSGSGLARTIQDLLLSQRLRSEMSAHGQLTVDGLGAGRVAESLAASVGTVTA
jgi:UDP-2,4-diacetamido-2,4,6-trideoxy-beta-L-altropyranose hydrolase